VATILATPYLLERLGVEPFGVVAAVAVVAAQMRALQMGIGPSATRLLAASRGRRDLREHASLMRAVVLLALIAALLVGGAFRLVAPLLWQHGFEISPATLELALASIAAAALIAAAQPALEAGFAVLLAEEEFAFLSLTRLGYGLIRVIGAVIAVALGWGVVGVIWVQAIVDIGTSLFVGLSPAIRRGVAAPGRPLREGMRALLGVGVPFAVADIFNSLLMDLEKLLIGILLSVTALTYYVVPFNAVVRLAILGGALSAVLLARISAVAAAGDSAGAAQLTHRATRLSIVAMAGMCAILIALSPELLTLWLGAVFAAEADLATRLLLLGIFANASVFAAHAAVRARLRPVELTMLYAAEVVLHVVITYYLILSWGIVGAALAWGIRVLVDAIAQRFLAVRALGHPIGPGIEVWIPLAILSIFTALCHLAGPDGVWLRGAGGLLIALAITAWLMDGEDWKLVRHTFSIPSRAGEAG
jgi:O-antigen/teichoic acid export membrane protein